MKAGEFIWYAGDPSVCERIEQALGHALALVSPLATNPRRSLYQLTLEPIAEKDLTRSEGVAEPVDVVVKIYHRRAGLRGGRERLKRIVGRSPGRREYFGLERLASLRIPTAQPLAWGRTAQGEEILVSRFVDGELLSERIGCMNAAERTATAEALARSVHRIHSAGEVHGDLHLGNLLYAASQPVLLDPQRMHLSRSPSEPLADWARLDASLDQSARRRSADREVAARLDSFRCLLRRSSGFEDQLDEARLVFDRDYQRGRARRVLRVGRRWQKLELAPNRVGLAESHMDAGQLEASLASLSDLSDLSGQEPSGQAAPEGTPSLTRRSGRVQIHRTSLGETPVVVKRVEAGSIFRGLADRFRGSAGARAFRAGQSSHLLGDYCARPLAFVESRRWGVPVVSWSWMESVGDADLDQCLANHSDETGEVLRIAQALGRWLGEAHARGFRHADLKATNIRVRVDPEEIRFWWVDLEDLRDSYPVRLAERIEALAQINASLADDLVPNAARWAALEAYSRRLPFEVPLEQVARQTAARSLTRKHRWTGRDCQQN